MNRCNSWPKRCRAEDRIPRPLSRRKSQQANRDPKRSQKVDWVVHGIDQDSPFVLKDPVLTDLAKKYSRTPAQVAMRHLLQRGIVALAKSFNPDRIKENFQVFDFELSDKDMKALNELDRNMRYTDGHLWFDHPKCPYQDEY